MTRHSPVSLRETELGNKGPNLRSDPWRSPSLKSASASASAHVTNQGAAFSTSTFYLAAHMATTALVGLCFLHEVSMRASLVVSTLPVVRSSEVNCPHTKTIASLQSGYARPSANGVYMLLPFFSRYSFDSVPNYSFLLKLLTSSPWDLHLFILGISPRWKSRFPKPYFGVTIALAIFLQTVQLHSKCPGEEYATAVEPWLSPALMFWLPRMLSRNLDDLSEWLQLGIKGRVT